MVNLELLRAERSTYRIDNAETSKRSRHLRNAERVRLVVIKVPERAFELLELSWGEVRHVPGHDLRSTMSEKLPLQDAIGTNLVVNERNLLDDALHDKFQFERQVLRCEHCMVVLIDVSS